MSEKVFALDGCDHVYHESCIREHILNEIKSRKAVLSCPDEKCDSEVNIEDLKGIIKKDEIESFYKNTLENYVDTHAVDVITIFKRKKAIII